jgi:hypothetical protein
MTRNGFRYTSKPLLGARLDSTHPLAQGLVADWLFNENGGDAIYDLCGRIPATLDQSASISTLGGAHYVASTDGPAVLLTLSNSELIYVGRPSTLTITGNITVIVRFNLTSFTTALSPTLLSLGYDGTSVGYSLGFNQFGIGPSNNTGDLTFYTFNGAISGSYTTKDFSSGSLGVWWTVAGTWDGTLWNTYVNGVLDRNSQGTQTLAPMGSTAPIVIGAESQSAVVGRFLDGKISRAAIYNRALSNNEIFEHYNNPFAMIAPPSVRLSPSFPFSQMVDVGTAMVPREPISITSY